MIAKWREGVSVTLIRDRLEKQARGELTTKVKDEKGRTKVVPYQMHPSELKAAHLLLERCIPTVSSMEISGPNQGPIETIDRRAVNQMDVAALTQLATILNRLAPKA